MFIFPPLKRDLVNGIKYYLKYVFVRILNRDMKKSKQKEN